MFLLQIFRRLGCCSKELHANYRNVGREITVFLRKSIIYDEKTRFSRDYEVLNATNAAMVLFNPDPDT